MFGLFLAPIFQTFAATTTAAAGCAKPTFLGVLVPWYQYLTLQSVPVKDPSNGATVYYTCQLTDFDKATNANPAAILGVHSPILLIALAILDDLIRIAALVAVGYGLYGGIQYETSNGAPDAIKRAQQTIINALIGLVLAILAASIVAFIGNQLG